MRILHEAPFLPSLLGLRSINCPGGGFFTRGRARLRPGHRCREDPHSGAQVGWRRKPLSTKLLPFARTLQTMPPGMAPARRVDSGEAAADVLLQASPGDRGNGCTPRRPHACDRCLS